MKTFLFLFMSLYLVLPNLFAQEINISKINAITDLDQSIFEVKNFDLRTLHENIANSKDSTLQGDENNLDTLIVKLFNLLELDNPTIDSDTLRFYFEKLRNYESVYEIYDKLKQKILDIEENMSDPKNTNQVTYLGGLKKNLFIVETHMNHLLEYNFSQYKNSNTSNQVIKGVYMEVDNDLFAFTNKDMNYTGGGRVEITTDYLKMRILPFANGEKVLSYQGIFIGFKAYTPYIRDTSIFNTPDSYDIDDRPFASYTYFGRSKYRIHSRGHIRMRSDFTLGVIGGDVGNVIQSIIHRDQFVSSLKPYGWDSQIAEGGRFAWNIDHYLELMLYSGSGDIFNLKRAKSSLLNFPINFDMHIGNELTALGAGIGFSTLSFRERSGKEDIKLQNSKKIRFLVSVNGGYRYVIHNSMLEGIGIFDTFQDDDDPLAPKDVYRLEANEVVRHLFLADLFIGFRTMKTTIYWKLTMNTKEYNKPKAKDFYQWGRFGVNFLL
jgi:hypothetical protein